MSLPNKIQGAFTGGELAPALWGRPDLAKYSIGAKTLRNAFVQVEGGVSNRQGTRYVFELGEEDCGFIPFEFNTEQTYQLVFYDHRVMFLQGGQVVVTNLVDPHDGYEWIQSTTAPGEYYFQAIGDAPPGLIQPKMMYEDGLEMPAGTIGELTSGQWAWGDNDSLGFNTLYVRIGAGVDPDSEEDGYLQIPYVVDSPYGVEDLPNLRFAHQYDTLVFSCRGFKQRKFVRYGHDDWRWEIQQTVGGPLGPINSENSKVINVTIENWSADRNYLPGEVVRPLSTTNATASWIGTFHSYESNTTIKSDWDSSSVPSAQRYYKSAWDDGKYMGTTIQYPFALIRIAKSAGLVAGNSISLYVSFIETGGASGYSKTGVINKVYSGTSYDYITVNFGWVYYFQSLTPVPAYCVPPGPELPDHPDGITFWWGTPTEYERRTIVFFAQADTAPQANGGGAMVTAVAGNVQKISSGAASYESINPSTGVNPGVTSGWNLYWRSLGSIPAEVLNVELTADGHNPYIENHVGSVIGLSELAKDRTISKEWASNAASTQYSDEVMVLGEVTMWTGGSWKGSLHLEKSTDRGVTWEEVVSIHSINQDHNGTLTREIMEGGTLIRMRFRPGGGVSATIKAYLRAESTFTHVVEVVAVLSSQKAIGRLVYGDSAPFSTPLWSFGQFGDDVGWPHTVTIHQQRMIYGGTVSNPKNIWGSRTGNYVNFAMSNLQLATEPIALEVSLAKEYEIRHLVPLKSLLILTSGSWHSLAGTDGTLTPTNGEVTLHGYGGVSSKISPLIVGLSVLCVQEDDRTVSELRYSLASDGYDRTEELGVMSKHLFRGKTITSWALQKDPNDLVWVTMSDGTLLSFTFLREQEVWAWTKHDTDGAFLRVGSVKSAAGGDDEVYFLIKRTVGGQSRYFLEYLSERLPGGQISDGVFMDCAVTYDGAPATVISGLDHLEGKAVAVLADGAVVAGKTVVNGSISLPVSASKVHVGLGYTTDLETLNMELGESTTSQGRKKAIRKVVARVQDSKGFWIGPSEDKLTLPAEWDRLAAGSLFSGDVEHRIKGDWNTGGTLFIRQTDPLPITVQAVIPFFELGE